MDHKQQRKDMLASRSSFTASATSPTRVVNTRDELTLSANALHFAILG